MEPTPEENPPPVVVIVAPPVPNLNYTVEQYLGLKAALASGARSVRYGDQQVDYQSPNQMRETLAAMESALGINTNVRRRGTPTFSKGL